MDACIDKNTCATWVGKYRESHVYLYMHTIVYYVQTPIHTASVLHAWKSQLSTMKYVPQATYQVLAEHIPETVHVSMCIYIYIYVCVCVRV